MLNELKKYTDWKFIWLVFLITIYSLGFITVNAYFINYHISRVFINPFIYIVIGSFLLIFFGLNIFFAYLGSREHGIKGSAFRGNFLINAFLLIIAMKIVVLGEYLSVTSLLFFAYFFYAIGSDWSYWSKSSLRESSDSFFKVTNILWIVMFFVMLIFEPLLRTLFVFFAISSLIFSSYFKYRDLYKRELVFVVLVVLIYIVVGAHLFANEVMKEYGLPLAGFHKQEIEIHIKGEDEPLTRATLIFLDDNEIYAHYESKTINMRRDNIESIYFLKTDTDDTEATTKRLTNYWNYFLESYNYVVYNKMLLYIGGGILSLLVILEIMNRMGVFMKVETREGSGGPYLFIFTHKNSEKADADKRNAIRDIIPNATFCVLMDSPEMRNAYYGYLADAPVRIDKRTKLEKFAKLYDISKREVIIGFVSDEVKTMKLLKIFVKVNKWCTLNDIDTRKSFLLFKMTKTYTVLEIHKQELLIDLKDLCL